MVDTSTIIESIYYLLKKVGPTDKLKLVKLLYLADKYHLIKYGRTITNDEYWAMYHGPVGSNVKDVLELDELTMSESECNFARTLFHEVGEKKFAANPKAKIDAFGFLSETDIEALDFVITTFGKMGTWDIREFSHKYPEWDQYKELFENKETKRERIQTQEMISVVDGDHFDFSAEELKEAKSTLLGAYE